MPRALWRPYGGLPASFVKTCQHSRVSVEGVGGWGLGVVGWGLGVGGGRSGFKSDMCTPFSGVQGTKRQQKGVWVTANERTRHMWDSQGHIPALAFR